MNVAHKIWSHSDRWLTKFAASGVDSRVAVWIGEFLLGRTQSQGRTAIIGASQSDVRSTVRKRSWLLLFLVYVNDIWRNIESTIRLFADDYVGRFLIIKTKQIKLHGLSPRANYTDRATAACRRSDCQLLRIKGTTWSAWRIPSTVFSIF
jgi:hypothetical protein